MQKQSQKKIKAARFRGIIKVGARVILLCSLFIFYESGDIVGLQRASANVQYGIQGRQAPELNLTNWIDGDGNRIDPIRLSSYRGKVIYLYFFQDW